MEFHIAIVNLVFRVVFGAVIMCQFDQSVAIKGALPVGSCSWSIEAEEVKVELVIRKPEFLGQCHVQEFVEFD